MREAHVKNLLGELDPISLDEMDGVKLLNRIDTKYVIPFRYFEKLMEMLGDRYYILDMDGKRIFKYVTTYFDTLDFQFYRDHHDKKLTRLKVRSRTYADTDVHYFEIKRKYNHRTKKYREMLTQEQGELTEEQREKIQKYYQRISPYYTEDFARSEEVADSLVPALITSFCRITLVNKEKTERCTIDLDLSFINPDVPDEEIKMDEIVIIEVKQSQSSTSQGIAASLNKHGIEPFSISKYVLGIINTQENVPHEAFDYLLDKVEELRELQKQKV